MHQLLLATCDALDVLADLVLKSWAEDRTLMEVHGWNQPALTRHDLAGFPKKLSVRIREASPEQLPPELATVLTDAPRRLQLLHGTTIPYMFNGNGVQAVPAYLATVEWLAETVNPLLGWQTLHDNKAMPAPLARRLRGIQIEVENLVPNKERLEEQIRQIQDATEAAENLPTDMQSLKEARSEIGRLSTDSAELYGKIDERYKNAIAATEHIIGRQVEADKLVQQCEEAYRITTTKGLAASFEQRANQLSTSMWIWVGGLFLALLVGAVLGSQRVELLSSAIAKSDPHWGVIWMNIVLSALSVGAPLWFAWLATKQIGQRFKLAEDYGFKASVAKAYEGYRREAARIDPAFEARLFDSALTRLDEAPLRLVGNTEHGSPWHELINSDAFQKAISIVPELKSKFIDLAKAGASRIDKVISEVPPKP
jgi:hypothetical protein